MSYLNHSQAGTDSDGNDILRIVRPKKDFRIPVTKNPIAQGAITRRPNGPIIVNGFSVKQPTVSLANLANMPAKNNVELRDRSTDLQFEKRYRAESYLIISRGIEQERPCTRCREGKGPYKKCIRVPDICAGGVSIPSKILREMVILTEIIHSMWQLYVQ